MGTLFLDRAGATLATEGEALLIRSPEGGRTLAPLRLLERVVITSDSTVDSGTLLKMAEYQISVVFLDPKRPSRRAHFLCPPGKDARRRIAQYEQFLQAEARRGWAREAVRGKLREQQRALTRFERGRPDLRHWFLEARGTIARVLESLEQSPAPDIPALLGKEGAAGAAYFSAYHRLFAPSLQFRTRTRRPPKDPVNAALSLAYTLATALAMGELHAAGLDPMAGFLHEPAYGRPSLACDCTEFLRARVDEWIYSLFRTRALRPESFGRQNDACLLKKTGRRTFYDAWSTVEPQWRRRLRAICRILVKRLTGGTTAAPDPFAAPEETDEEPVSAASH